jgi:serine/threonine protein phosphatase PrpC
LFANSQGPRDEQQDSAIRLHNEALGTALLVVGDGVGGRSGGRIASQKLTEMASELWAERKGNLAKPEEDLGMLCRVAHEHINNEGAKLGISPRTTVVALYLTRTNAWWVHSGDSRVYHFRARQFVERSEDHSLLEMMVQQGAVKEEEMGSHPDQGTLLQSLGGGEYMHPSLGSAEIGADDGFLLCTDGFWERTKPEEMIELVFSPVEEAADRLGQAVDRAVERNGPRGDNVTVIVALPSGAVPMPSATSGKNSGRVLLLAALAAFLLAVMFLYWPGGKKAAAQAAPTPPLAAPAAAPPSPPPVAAPAPAPAAAEPSVRAEPVVRRAVDDERIKPVAQ